MFERISVGKRLSGKLLTTRRCGLVPARREALAWCHSDYGHDTHRHSGKLNGKVVDWMEQVSDEQYRAASRGGSAD
jgi:hypothetical protein